MMTKSMLLAAAFGSLTLDAHAQSTQSTSCQNVGPSVIVCTTTEKPIAAARARDIPPFMREPAIPVVPSPVAESFGAGVAQRTGVWPPSLVSSSPASKPSAAEPWFLNGAYMGASPTGRWLSVTETIPTIRVIR